MSLERFTRKQIAAVGPQASVVEVARLMEKRHVGAVVVTVDERPIGIVTDRDLALRAVAHGQPLSLPIVEIMSAELIVAHRDDGLDQALFAMRANGVRRLPIVDEAGVLCGMVSLDDLLVLLSAEISCGAETVLDNRGP
jgi:CBS domain-containing protein